MDDCCEMCGGQLVLLGTLGNLDHFTCRDCGMMYSRPFRDHDYDDDCQCDVCFNERR